MILIKDNPVTLSIDSEIDLTSSTEVAIGYRKPDDTVGSWVGVTSLTPTDGIISYDVTDEIDQSDLWDFWSIVTITGETYLGPAIKVEVFTTPPEETRITDLAFVRAWLGKTDTSSDFKINNLIDLIQEDYLRISNYSVEPIVDSDGVQTGWSWPSGSNIVAAEMIEHSLQRSGQGDMVIPEGVDSFRLGSFSVSMNNTQRVNGYPKSIISRIPIKVRGE